MQTTFFIIDNLSKACIKVTHTRNYFPEMYTQLLVKNIKNQLISK